MIEIWHAAQRTPPWPAAHAYDAFGVSLRLVAVHDSAPPKHGNTTTVAASHRSETDQKPSKGDSTPRGQDTPSVVGHGMQSAARRRE